MSKSKIEQFTPEEVQQIVNQSSTKREVAIKLGYSSDGGTTHKTLNKYFEKYNIDTSSLTSKSNPVYTRETVFCEHDTIAQHSLVSWYKKKIFLINVLSVDKNHFGIINH